MTSKADYETAAYERKFARWVKAAGKDLDTLPDAERRILEARFRLFDKGGHEIVAAMAKTAKRRDPDPDGDEDDDDDGHDGMDAADDDDEVDADEEDEDEDEEEERRALRADAAFAAWVAEGNGDVNMMGGVERELLRAFYLNNIAGD